VDGAETQTPQVPVATSDGPTADASPTPTPTAPDESTDGLTEPERDDTWIFPFDEPLAPGEGDNQAVAVNTTDDTASYSVAFALVWADGSEPAENTNEAFAAASCTNCAAIAVAFQIVLVVGDVDVAVPQNLAVAANYECTSCLTYALAVQLFITLPGPLSDEAVASIEELWQQIADYGATIAQVPLDEIQAQLTAYEQQVLDIIEADQGPLTDTDPAQPTDDPSSTPAESESPSGTTTPETVEPSESTTTPATPLPSESTSPTPTETPSPSPTTSPTPTTASPTSSPTSSPTTPAPTSTSPAADPTESASPG
jgi:putative peptide zinc metalloprotease protein